MNTHATIRADVSDFKKLFREASGGYHEDLLLRVTPDTVETLMQTGGRQTISYCTYSHDYFAEVSGEVEALLPVGGSGADQKGVLDYLDFAGEGTVEMSFRGEDEEGEHAPLATHWKAEGALSVQTRLPSSDNDLDAVPWDHPLRWTGDNQYVSKKCLTDDNEIPDDEDEIIVGPVVIETSTETVQQKIIEPADFLDSVNYYPVATEDGEFVVDIEGGQHDDEIWGAVNAERVEGPDVHREFKKGFEEIIFSLRGQVRLQTAPEGSGGTAPPLTIVQDQHPDHTIRHLVSALAGAN